MGANMGHRAYFVNPYMAHLRPTYLAMPTYLAYGTLPAVGYMAFSHGLAYG